MAKPWCSTLIQLLRYGEDPDILRKRERYLVLRENEPQAEYDMEMNHEEYLALLGPLRYVEGASEGDRAAACAKVGKLVMRMLDSPPVGSAAATREPSLAAPSAPATQLDVVLTAKELAALPLEAACASDGTPLVLRAAPVIEITRRVRGAFRATSQRWPSRPRVLFAAAAPKRQVPAKGHERALRAALRPWLEALEDVPGSALNERAEREVLTFLPRASLGEIRQVCEESRRRGGFTHVHLLAHGCELESGMHERYGLELHSEVGRGAAQVAPDDLVEALRMTGTLPNVVTITACDSGNEGSPVVSSASLAHALHAAGVPIVLGSQFPLTDPGSTVVVETFYGALLRPPRLEATPRGTDVRDAIHEARLAVSTNRPLTGHDWMSVVAYIQLPEGYDDRLVDVGLETELAVLRTAQRWADALFVHAGATPAHYERVSERLRDAIDRLFEWSKRAAETGRKDSLDESRGLLGSAHKRLAELLFRRAALGGDADRWRAESRRALEGAREWYGRGFRANQQAHWLGVQQLSLEAVLDGRLTRPWQWHAVLDVASGDPADVWGAGTCAELHLLARCAGEPRQVGRAVEALKGLEARVDAQPKRDAFPLESTARQLQRYMHWWTTGNGFFPGAADLVADATDVFERAGCARWLGGG